jgi:hypothetical protein
MDPSIPLLPPPPRSLAIFTRDAIASFALGPTGQRAASKADHLLSPHGTTWIWQADRCRLGPARQWRDGSFSYREGRSTFARPSNDVHPPSCNYSSEETVWPSMPSYSRSCHSQGRLVCFFCYDYFIYSWGDFLRWHLVSYAIHVAPFF